MGFRTDTRFVFIYSNELKPVQEEIKKNRMKKIMVEPTSEGLNFLLIQEEVFTGKSVEVLLLESEWVLFYNSQTNSYSITCSIQNDGEEDAREVKSAELNPEVGAYVDELLGGLFNGEITGSAAEKLVRLLFREFEIKNAPDDSWVKQHFPQLFKSEERVIEKQRKKIVKGVMET